jgi:hypothetical protein
MTTAERVLIDALTDVRAATGVRYGLRDDRGVSMDTLKVVGHPDGGYLGVYHSRARGGRSFTVHLARSADLLTWTRHADLDRDASQPMLTALPGGAFLLVVEAGGAGRPAWLRVHHYPDARDLLAARPDRTFDAPHTLVPPDRFAEGTPHVEAATGTGDLDGSVIDIGFHYHRDGVVDRQGRGRLTGFRQWRAAADPAADAAIERWDVHGNIGGRDTAGWNGARITLVEGQLRRGDWGSWRVFRYDRATGVATPLPIRTHGGSTAFANPTVTVLPAPSGRTALLATMFVVGEGAASGEAGPLLYFRELPGDARVGR